MPERQAFSQRNNFYRAAVINIVGTAPDELRDFLYKALVRYISENFARRDFAYGALDEISPISTSLPMVILETQMLVSNTAWFHVYDLVEALYRHLNTANRIEFRRLVNAFFEREGYAYNLTVEGRIEHRGEESFDAAVKNADISLAAAGSVTARDEIHKSLEDLAKRPNADLTGAVQHAMAGLECIANQAAGSSGIELGKLVKGRPDLFPPPLNEVIPKLYGYASNNGRHLTEGEEPDFAEAELLVGIAAITATYLARKL